MCGLVFVQVRQTKKVTQCTLQLSNCSAGRRMCSCHHYLAAVRVVSLLYVGVVLFHCLVCFGFASGLVPAVLAPWVALLSAALPIPFLLLPSSRSTPSVVTYLHGSVVLFSLVFTLCCGHWCLPCELALWPPTDRRCNAPPPPPPTCELTTKPELTAS